VAQILFFESDEPCESSYKDRGGKYQASAGDAAQALTFAAMASLRLCPSYDLTIPSCVARIAAGNAFTRQRRRSSNAAHRDVRGSP